MRFDFIKRLTVILGEQQLLTDPADCLSYGFDNSTLQGQPIAVALPESHQQVVHLRIDGYEIVEIAKRSSVSRRGVERILQSFRARLRKKLDIE